MTDKLLIANIISTMVLTFLAFALKVIVNAQSRRYEAKKNEIDKISNSLINQTIASRAKAIELLIKKLPEKFEPTNLVNELDSQLKKLENRINVSHDMDTKNVVDKFPYVENLVNEYHQQALKQARLQFWFSIIAAFAGFAWIILGAINISPSNIFNYFKIVPGIIIDALAYLFFRQAEATRERATALYDRLRADFQQSKAIQLADTIEDQKIRAIVKAQLTLHMAGLDHKFINLSDSIKSAIVT